MWADGASGKEIGCAVGKSASIVLARRQLLGLPTRFTMSEIPKRRQKSQASLKRPALALPIATEGFIKPPTLAQLMAGR
jgi:hypothetical protein